MAIIHPQVVTLAFLLPQNRVGHIFSDSVSKSGPDFMLYCTCSKFSFQRTIDSQKLAEMLEKSHVTFTQFLPMVTSYMNYSTIWKLGN